MMSRRVLSISSLLVLLACCGEPIEPPRPAPAGIESFRDITDALGIQIHHDAGPIDPTDMPQIMGSGAALFDCDRDGDLDLYLVNTRDPRGRGAPDVLLRRDANGHFEESVGAATVTEPGRGMGVAVGDVDGDGWPDLYLTRVGPNVLLRNRGDGTFEDRTVAAGVAGGAEWSASAVFADADGDGDEDLYVTNYLAFDPSVHCPDAAGRPDYCGPRRFPGVRDRFYRNRGDGTFDDVTESSGIGSAQRRGLGVVAADLDVDGNLDFYVANDNDPNLLWLGRGNGTFEEAAVERGVAFNHAGRAEAGMGLAAADLNDDGRLDLFVTNLRGETNTAYLARASGDFDDGTEASGLGGSSLPYTGFGVAVADFNGAGAPAIVIVNGDVFRGTARAPELGDHYSQYAQPPLFHRREHDGRFVAEDGGELFRARVSRGLVLGDLDEDGDLDLIVTSVADRVRVFETIEPRRGALVTIAAKSSERALPVAGATIVIDVGGSVRVAVSGGNAGYLTSGPRTVTFGLGDAKRIDELTVRWPGGLVESFGGHPAKGSLVVVRGRGTRR